MTMRFQRILATLLATSALVGVSWRSTAAHPLATTTVSIVARGSALDVTISADADPLIAKLEVFGNRTASTPHTADERARRLRELAGSLLSRIDLRADGSALSLTGLSIAVDDTAQVSWRFSAPLANDTQAITWSCAFIFGSYPLAVRAADGREVIEWLQ